MLHTILIDDDPNTLDTIALELQIYCPNDVSVIKKCACPTEGLTAIRQLKPDLVLLDVEMPRLTGIELVRILRGEQCPSDFVFMTAHEAFSLKAFELNALHYLLKPYHSGQLVEAVNRAKAKRMPLENYVTIGQVEALIFEARKPKNLRISTRDGVEFLPIEDIIYAQANGNYAIIHLCNNERRLVSNPLKDIENQLLKLTASFQRTHQSYLVNLDFLKGFRRDGSVILRGVSVEIPVSKAYKSTLMSSE